jgi:hypothetical protein
MSLGFTNGFNEKLQWDGKVCDDKTRKTDCSIKEWIQYGAEKEDAERWFPPAQASLRSFNHFHDPISGKGLHDLGKSGMSALEWAQNPEEQGKLNYFGNSIWPEGDQSWPTLRALYLQTLLDTDDTSRRAKFARLFKGLGHQMHLVQDMAVPTHVRNDAHPLDPLLGRNYRGTFYFETWAKTHNSEITAMASGPAVYPLLDFTTPYTANSSLVSISQIWDANRYDGTNPSASSTQGISEYTNANFLSTDTIFKQSNDNHYFPYPKTTSTDLPQYINDNLLPERIVSADGKVDNRFYISKVDHGQTVGHFLRVGYFSNDTRSEPGQESVFFRTLYLDEACHRSYAEKLVPRAVGYSAAILDYFFRGTLEIRHPFVKFVSNGTTLSIGGFEFDAQNVSMIGNADEPLISGSLQLAYRYLTPAEMKKQDEKDRIYSYGLVPNTRIHRKDSTAPYTVLERGTVTEPLNDGRVRLEAFLPTGTNIPLDASEITFWLVFSGTLGSEVNTGVAVGSHRFETQALKDITRIAYSYQHGGKDTQPIHPSNIFTVLASGEDIRNITRLNPLPVPVGGRFTGYFAPAWSPKGNLLAFEQEQCGQTRPPDDFPVIHCNVEDRRRDIVIVDQAAGPPDPTRPAILLEYAASNYPFPHSNATLRSAIYLPSFSPDGEKVACIIEHPLIAHQDLGWFSLPTPQSPTPLANIVGGWKSPGLSYWDKKSLFGAGPVWSPMSNTIAYYYDSYNFSTAPSPVKGIYTIRPNGANDTPIADDDFWNTQHAYSPDGNLFVFISNRGRPVGDYSEGSLDLWLMDVNGGAITLLYDGAKSCFTPTFSPDGLRVAFRQGGSICTVNLSGQDFKAVSSIPVGSPDYLGDVTWSPYLDDYAPALTLTAKQGNTTVGQIKSGESVDLVWISHGADKISIDNGIGDQPALSGSVKVWPTADTIYTVCAYNWAAKSTAKVAISVKP